MARETDRHASELQELAAAHQREMEARKGTEGAVALRALEAEKDAAVRALSEAQARMKTALEAAAKSHVLQGQLEQERKARAAAENALATAHTEAGTAAASPGVSAVATAASFFSPALLSSATGSQISGAFTGFSGFSAALAGDPSTSIFGSSADDPSTSLFGSSDENVQQTTSSPLHQHSAVEPDDATRQQAESEDVAALKEKMRLSLQKALEVKKTLEAENSELKQQLSAAHAQVDLLRNSSDSNALADAQQRIEAAKEEAAAARTEVEEAERRVREGEEKARMMLVKAVDAKKQLQTKLQDKANEMHHLEVRLAAVTEENASLKDSYSPHGNDRDAEAWEQVKRLQKELGESREQVELMNRRMKDSSYDNTEAVREIEREEAKSEMQALSAQLKRMEEELAAAQAETAAAHDDAEKQVMDGKEQLRDMLAKAADARQELQAKITALAEENSALVAQVASFECHKASGEDELEKALRAELSASQAEQHAVATRLQQALEEKEEYARRFCAETARLEAEREHANAGSAEASERAATAQAQVDVLEARLKEADSQAADEAKRLREAAAVASASRDQLLARQDELCRKLNEAEEAARKVRKQAEMDAAEATREKQGLRQELDAAKAAVVENEALRKQSEVQTKQLAVLQRQLVTTETDAEAGAKLRDAEIESVKDKSKQYIKKAVDQQKLLQARVRELEEQLEQVRNVGSEAAATAEELQNQRTDTEAQLNVARADKEAAEARLKSVEMEFERYKARAHTLLKKGDESAGAGGRDVTGTLEALTQELADKDSVIQMLREKVAASDKHRLAIEREAHDYKGELAALGQQLKSIEAARDADRRRTQEQIDALEKEVRDAKEERAAVAMLSQALEVTSKGMEEQVGVVERALAAAAVALPLLQSHLFDAQMIARRLEHERGSALLHSQDASGLVLGKTVGSETGKASGANAGDVGLAAQGGGVGGSMGNLSPFDARSRSSLRIDTPAATATTATAPEKVLQEPVEESVRLANLLLAPRDAPGAGVEPVPDGTIRENDLVRLQKQVETERARLEQEQQGSVLYVTRMKEELMSAISERDRCLCDSYVWC